MNFLRQYMGRPHPVVVLGILAISVLLLWQAGHELGFLGESNSDVVSGEVVSVLSEEEMDGYTEQDVSVRLENEREVVAKNRLVALEEGDEVYVSQSLFQEGAEEPAFSVVEVGRTNGMLLLLLGFVVAVLLVGGVKGFSSLVGLLLTFAVLLSFILPRILEGQNAVFVSLAGAACILLGTLYVSHGFNKKSLAALGGVFISLVLVALLAQASVAALNFTGFSGEGAAFLVTQEEGAVHFNLVDLIVAGIIIAGIGVLDDVAVTQAATVFSLSSSAKLRGRRLFVKAYEVGKDHISAVVNTLVLAYAGAGLPLLLLFTLNQSPGGLVASSEIIAIEITRTLISSIGLVLAIPLTTAISVLLLRVKGQESVE